MNGTKEALDARIILIQFMATGFSLCKFNGDSFPPMDVQYCLRASDVLADASLLPITDCNVLVNGSISLRAKVRNSFDINNLSSSPPHSSLLLLQPKSRDLVFREKGQDASLFPAVISAASLRFAA